MRLQVIITAATVAAALVQASVVNLNLSSAYNYDAYVTGAEIAANGNPVSSGLGDHSIQYGMTGYAHLVNPDGALYKGIPDTIINGGEFELAAGLTGDKFGTAAGTSKVNNSIACLYNASSLSYTATVMLEAGQLARYSDFNLLVNGQRYGTRSGVVMSAMIEVKYAGDANWYSIWSESADISAGAAGGVFGGQFTGTTYNYQSAAWEAVIVNDAVANGIYKVTSASGTDTMWKLAVPALLDDTQILEGFRLTSSTTAANRINDFILYAASVTPAVIPEPTAAGMLGAGALVAAVIRRLKA